MIPKKTALFITLLTFIVMPGIIQAQVLEFSPSFPTADDSLEIIFNAEEGNGALAGFDGDVFLHTGVITEESSDNSDWKHVQSGWEETIPKLKATPIGDNKWRFVYKPTINEFFGVLSDEKVVKVAMLFRGFKNGDIEAVGRPEGGDGVGNDFFVDIFSKDLNVQFTKPANDLNFAEQNQSTAIQGIANEPDDITLKLEIDGNEVASANNDTLNFDFTPSSSGTFKLDLIGTSPDLDPDTARTSITVNPPVADENRPAGLKDGITYKNGGTSVTLSLFAPNKEFIYVIGDFNNWELDTDFFMKREQANADSTWWWIEIDGLTPGQEYGFQYLVDGELRVTDPYAELILDPSEDQFIDPQTFPNLKPYPDGKTDKQVGVLQPGKEDFQFEVQDFEKPDAQELVIYELLVRDFTDNHDFKTLTDSLDYLADLGVNAIELMPIMEFEGNTSWGYNPTFFFAVDKYYGPAEDLKRFIDEAHKRGMAVILDMVHNHHFGRSPLVRLYSSGNFGPPTEENPWFNVEARHPFNVGFDMNHESAATKHFIDRVNSYWLEEFNFDGFRFDLSKGFTQNNTLGDVGAWGQFDQSRVNILQRMADKIWETDSDAYIILEHLADEPEEIALSEYRTNEGKDGMFLWSKMNREYNQLSMGFFDSDDFSNSIDRAWFGNTNFNVPNQITYMESHDEQWMMFRNLEFGNSSNPDHNVKELDVALERQKIAGAFFLTIPGPKMLWQFGELGYGFGDNGEQCLGGECPPIAPGRTAEKPIRWDYYDDPDRKKLYKTWAAIMKARNDYGIFADPSTNVETSIGEDQAFRWIKLSNDTLEAIVVGNFDVESREFNIPVDDDQLGEWFDYFTGDPVNFQPQNRRRPFKPAEFRIFTSEPLETPESGLVTDVEDEQVSSTPREFKLKQNFPNPFNPSTRIEYDLARSSEVTLQIYDILGRKVATLVNNKRQSAGTHSINFNASRLSSGVYIMLMKAGDFTSTQKITLIK